MKFNFLASGLFSLAWGIGGQDPSVKHTAAIDLARAVHSQLAVLAVEVRRVALSTQAPEAKDPLVILAPEPGRRPQLHPRRSLPECEEAAPSGQARHLDR